MTPDQSGEIIRQIAILGEQILGVRRDLVRQDQGAAELYEKVNAVAEDVATVKGDVKVAGLVAAQARDEVKGLKETVEKAAPTISDMENYKKIGAWIFGGGAVALVGTGVAFLAWGESMKTSIAHWLGIK